MAPALTGLGRVFINSKGPGNKYLYHSCMKIDGIDKSLGDVTPIYCPDPIEYDKFIEVATVKGADGRATSTLTAYLPINTISPLEEIYNQGCSFDLQVHYGTCTKPDAFNEFESAIVLTDVRFTSYGLSTLTARTPDERAVVDETAAISIGNFYRILPIKETRLPVIFLPTNAYSFGIVNVSSKSCGDNCDTRSTGCDTWVTGVINASDTISFVYTTDGGVTWTPVSAAASTLHNGDVRSANMVVHGGYIYFTTTAGTTASFYRTSIDSILNGASDTVKIMPDATTTFIYEMKASENYVWYAGQRASTTSTVRAFDPSLGTFQQFTGDTQTFRALDALDDDHVLVGGLSGTLYYSTSYGVFTEITTPFPTATVTGVKMFSANRWLVATSNGTYLTTNAGSTFNLVSASTNWARLSFYDDNTGYLNSTTGTSRTLDGGNTWSKISSLTTFSTNDLQVCEYNPNVYFVVGGDPTGFISKGSP
jgi:hypothetical protein